MNNAELYEKNNSLQKRDALKCLDEYAHKIQWKPYGDRVLDIGCGDGGVTSILKRNYIPAYYSKLVGCDISENMIEFANQRHGDRRTEFKVLDVQGKLPRAFIENFDHVVSFNALHWIKDQRTAFRNIYKMLADNGDCLLLFLGHMPIYDVYRVLSRKPKWSPWMSDVDQFVSPYHDSPDPETEITKILTKVGFEEIEVSCNKAEFVFHDENQWKEAVAAINPFGIPKELIDDFLDDYSEVVSEMRLLDRANNNIQDNFKVTVTYDSLVVYARKCSAI